MESALTISAPSSCARNRDASVLPTAVGPAMMRMGLSKGMCRDPRILFVRLDRLAQRDGLYCLLPHLQVEHLHSDGKGHGKIDIPFRDVEIKAFGEQRDADDHEKTEGEDLDRRVLVDELTDPSGGKH